MARTGSLILTLGPVGECACIKLGDGRVAHISIAEVRGEAGRVRVAFRVPNDLVVYRTLERDPASLTVADAPMTASSAAALARGPHPNRQQL